MKNRLIVGLGVVVNALTGIVIGQALPRPVAEAQMPMPGFRECISASLWHHDGAAMGSPSFRPRTVTVPRGWVPVGGGGVGGGNNAQFAVVLCR